VQSVIVFKTSKGRNLIPETEVNIMFNNKIDYKIPAVLGALAITLATAAPSFAWGFNPWGWGGNRYEVAGRDAQLRNEINMDRGYLGGNYGYLSHEDNSIRRQEQRDLCRNGGYLTYGQTRHLNHEENRLQHQINNSGRYW
jgi:hypothetical protein